MALSKFIVALLILAMAEKGHLCLMFNVTEDTRTRRGDVVNEFPSALYSYVQTVSLDDDILVQSRPTHHQTTFEFSFRIIDIINENPRGLKGA